jgi:hypothetical protein
MEYPAVGSPAPSRLPPTTFAASRIEMLPPGISPSRITKAERPGQNQLIGLQLAEQSA